MNAKPAFFVLIALLFSFQIGCQADPGAPSTVEQITDHEDLSDHLQGEVQAEVDGDRIQELGCKKVTTSQLFQVNLGNDKKDEFLDLCVRKTGSTYWCSQLIRPNPRSSSVFRCTYGSDQVHQLIHPQESVWKYPITAVQVVQELVSKGIKVCEIYNWWRPEPYNKNVGGAAGRHPYGTSVDVRFCSNSEAIRAFSELCKIRKKGRIRALGYYGSAALHIGVGDRTANTWGRSCP